MKYLEEDPAWDFDIEEFLEESQRKERQRIEQELERISIQLEERNQLHDEIVDEVESKLDWYKTRLEKLYKQHRGKHGRRTQLKEKIAELYQELRTEKQRVWQDKQRLEKERRELLRELDEMVENQLSDLL